MRNRLHKLLPIVILVVGAIVGLNIKPLPVTSMVLANAAITRPSPPSLVFILAGQSNMLGRGKPLSAGLSSDVRLFVWRDKWKVAADPLGYWKDKNNGIGPGMAFGLNLLSHFDPGITVGLIQCAKGGSEISAWRTGAAPFRACANQVAASRATVAGVLFLQGESEARSMSGSTGWAAGFQMVLTSFRDRYGASLPFLLGQIGTLIDRPYQQQVRDAQAAAAASNSGITLVITTDLPVQPDGVHFTVGAYHDVGTRFATAWFTRI